MTDRIDRRIHRLEDTIGRQHGQCDCPMELVWPEAGLARQSPGLRVERCPRCGGAREHVVMSWPEENA